MLNPSFRILNPDTVFIHAQCLVALADQPLIWLLDTSGVGRNHQTRPKSVLVTKVRQLLLDDLLEGVDPVEVGL